MSDSGTMKELPTTERPYEKCMQQGPEALSDAELLAVILRSGSRELTAVELSRKLLSLHQGKRPLADITRSTIAELCEIPGIGRVKAIQLQCLGELARRMAREDAGERLCMNTAQSVAGFFMEDMRHLEQEEMRAALFDSKNHLLRTLTLSRGTVNMSVITPREIFLSALRHQAVSVIILHNHPSGDPTPSEEDIRLTHRIQAAGIMLEIPLLDHIIIGDRSYFSFKERNLI